jgi:hypothetical protein
MEDHEEQRSQFFGVIKSARSFINLIKSINIKNVNDFFKKKGRID